MSECEYCNPKHGKFSEMISREGLYGYVRIDFGQFENGDYVIYASVGDNEKSQGDYSKKVNYCPMCGRKLAEDNDE